MVEVESNLVYASGDIAVTADLGEYLISDDLDDFGGFLEEGLWIDGETTFLQEVSEEDKLQFDIDNSTGPVSHYYLKQASSGLKIEFLPIPAEDCTVKTLYWISSSSYTIDENFNEWSGIWDNYISRRIEEEIRQIFEMDTSSVLMKISMAEESAMREVYLRGTRVSRRRTSSDFFSVEGV
jgi:hypothetical protein